LRASGGRRRTILMRERPSTAPVGKKPLWLRALIWIGIGYAALNVFALTTMMVQNGSLNGLFPLAMVVGLGWFLYRKFRTQSEDAGESLSDNYGTARFEGMQITPPHADWLREGVFLGKSSHPQANSVPLDKQPGIPVCTTPEHHTFIVARTRTGKGTRVIVPTLLRYSGSAIVIDPKGENAAITARVRAGLLAQAVHVINPWGELATTFKARGLTSATFNPLDGLVRADPKAVAAAQALAGAVGPAGPADKDRYWQGSAANVLAAVFLWITDQPGEQKTLARAREIVR